MAKVQKEYPKISLPTNRGEITVQDVLGTAIGIERDQMIQKWCISVWEAFSEQHNDITTLTEKLLKK